MRVDATWLPDKITLAWYFESAEDQGLIKYQANITLPVHYVGKGKAYEININTDIPSFLVLFFFGGRGFHLVLSIGIPFSLTRAQGSGSVLKKQVQSTQFPCMGSRDGTKCCASWKTGLIILTHHSSLWSEPKTSRKLVVK